MRSAARRSRSSLGLAEHRRQVRMLPLPQAPRQCNLQRLRPSVPLTSSRRNPSGPRGDRSGKVSLSEHLAANSLLPLFAARVRAPIVREISGIAGAGGRAMNLQSKTAAEIDQWIRNYEKACQTREGRYAELLEERA